MTAIPLTHNDLIVHPVEPFRHVDNCLHKEVANGFQTENRMKWKAQVGCVLLGVEGMRAHKLHHAGFYVSHLYSNLRTVIHFVLFPEQHIGQIDIIFDIDVHGPQRMIP